MLKIIICDSSKDEVTRTVEQSKRIIKKNGFDIDIDLMTTSPDKLLKKSFDENNAYLIITDVIYSDYNMTGIDISMYLRSRCRNLYIAFLSRHIELITMTLKGNIMPSGFIKKPSAAADLDSLISDVYGYYLQLQEKDVRTLIVNSGQNMYKIPFDKIIYVEAYEKKIHIHMISQRISYYSSLSSLEEELGAGFVRCHKSYLINRNKIVEVLASEMIIIMENKAKIPISRTFRGNIKNFLSSDK